MYPVLTHAFKSQASNAYFAIAGLYVSFKTEVSFDNSCLRKLIIRSMINKEDITKTVSINGDCLNWLLASHEKKTIDSLCAFSLPDTLQ